MYPAMLASPINHYMTKTNKGETAYMTYYTVFYLLVFSAIPHKEMRFLLPILPFCFMMIGEMLA